MHISVWLGEFDRPIHERYKFRCIFCGKVVNEVEGEVRHIRTGDTVAVARAVTVQCRCRTMYSFH